VLNSIEAGPYMENSITNPTTKMQTQKTIAKRKIFSTQRAAG